MKEKEDEPPSYEDVQKEEKYIEQKYINNETKDLGKICKPHEKH